MLIKDIFKDVAEIKGVAVNAFSLKFCGILRFCTFYIQNAALNKL